MKISLLFKCIYFFITLTFLFLVNEVYSQNKFYYDSLNFHISKYMEANRVPGLVICALNEDSIIWSNSYGKANIETGLNMNIDATMMIASVSKTFTSTAIMQLWEKGMLELDRDINGYLPFSIRNPRFPDTPITIKQLLTHTSSIHDSPIYDKSYQCGKSKLSLEKWNEYYFKIDGIFYNKNKNFTKFQPGINREYSNVGFGLLGYIVEVVSKMPFNDYCRKNIFEPLGMVNTGWFYNEVDTNNQIVNYYFLDKKRIYDSELQKLALKKPTKKDLHTNIPLCKYSFPTYPDGSIITSVKELSYFLRAMINDGIYDNVQIIQKETIDKMFTVYFEEEGAEQLQGLCWNKSIFKSFWGHSGGDYGIHTYMYLNRANSVGIITFQNSISANPWKFVAKLYRIVENEMN